MYALRVWLVYFYLRLNVSFSYHDRTPSYPLIANSSDYFRVLRQGGHELHQLLVSSDARVASCSMRLHPAAIGGDPVAVVFSSLSAALNVS